MNIERLPLRADWNVKAIRFGEVIFEETRKNVIVANGRLEALRLLFGSGTPFTVMGVGACSASATASDTHLTNEYIVTGLVPSNTRYPLTDVNGAAVDSTDFILETVVDNSETPPLTYYATGTVMSVVPLEDPNYNQYYQEFGIFNSTLTPATPSGTSGTMLNHLVLNTPVYRDQDTILVITIQFRC